MTSNQHLTFIYECTIRPQQRDAWEALFPELVAVAAAEQGTVAYRCHPGPDDRICLFEKYATSDAAITHMHGFGPTFGERFMAAVAIERVTLLGSPSAELAQMIAPMFSGAVDGMTATAYGSADS